MKAHWETRDDDYQVKEGLRFSTIPFLHFPDLCPFWGEQDYGNCRKMACGGMRAVSRPCVEKANSILKGESDEEDVQKGSS